MSLYNAIFGVNPFAPLLLGALGIEPGRGNPTGFSAGRFRDAYLKRDDAGKLTICLYTRNGGGNRDCWSAEGCDEAKDVHGPSCLVFVNKRLAEHPAYIGDKDDGFDCTYATFEFRVPERFVEGFEKLYTLAFPLMKDPAGRWKPFLDKLRKNDQSDPEVQRAMEVGKEITAKLNETLEGGPGGVTVIEV